MLHWHFILAIALGGLGFIIIVGCVIRLCIKLNNKYAPVSDVDPADEPSDKNEIDLEKHPEKGARIRSDSNQVITIDEVNDAIGSARESSAEHCRSDVEDDAVSRTSISSRGSLSAYGDQTSMSGSMISLASNASWSSSATHNLNLNVQCSLIYSKDMRHIAGKIIQVDGLRFNGGKKPSHVRVHVVVLPIKKYALKTSWYEINSQGKVKIAEYFKFVFKLPPSELKTMLRVRLYGRKAKVGSLGRPSCMGECYITLLEIINSKGGITLWRSLSRGIPESILESQGID